jgi:crotonobetainyl-CoA:carnitine CoA-transferase CaiB-like acyl-CoA transferase
MNALLHGIRVIDCTAAASGPFATMILAEQGADVIKVERPDGGDFMRSLGTQHNGLTGVFAGFNRGKRSVAIDAKQPDGADLVRKLVATADVFVHNYRPGVVERLALAEPDLRTVRPDLVYVTISGFGLRGDGIGRPAYDSVMQAASGLAAHQGDDEYGPEFVRNAVCDKVTALTTAQLVSAALFARERGAGPQHVHVSMLHAALAFLWPDGMQDVTFLDRSVDSHSARATSPPVRRTADGYISITTLLDQEFRGLCEVLGLAALVDDPRFAHAGARSRNANELHPLVNEVVARWPTRTLADRLAERGVPNAVVNAPADIHLDPQVVANELLVVVDHPVGGHLRVPRPVGELDDEPFEVQRLAPGLGEHTDEVLGSIGVDAAARADLRARGVIA